MTHQQLRRQPKKLLAAVVVLVFVLIISLTLTIVLARRGAASRGGADEKNGADFRLPSTVHPVHYDILLRPDLDSMTFEVMQIIDLIIDQDNTTEIKLNSLHLELSNVELFYDSNSTAISPER